MYEVDDCWKTRRINEAQLQGYTVLRLTCSNCGHITDYPFVLLLQRHGITPHSFLGNIRFKCEQCGSKEPHIGVHCPISAPGYLNR